MEKIINKLKNIEASEWFALFLLCCVLVILFWSIKIGESYADYVTKFDLLNQEHEALKDEKDKLNVDLNIKTSAYEKLLDENIALTKIVEEKPIKDVLQIAGDIYGIDPKLLEAIERLETGHYSSKNYKNLNNTWGARYDSNGYLSFESHEQSTMELARTLKLYYIDQGLDTVEKIASKYCPDDSSWASKVMIIYHELE